VTISSNAISGGIYLSLRQRDRRRHLIRAIFGGIYLPA
jgi:hypothetical protein